MNKAPVRRWVPAAVIAVGFAIAGWNPLGIEHYWFQYVSLVIVVVLYGLDYYYKRHS